ncbi:MAG: pitrilysin family protein, partial [Thermodesulfobacteriota bacterium]|nr:pitrilysin family protein [Thermodesulfobacteriota bacterium]
MKTGLFFSCKGIGKTCFHARVLARHFPALADILSDIFLNSIFDPKDLDRERQVILQEINMTEDTPDDHIHVLFNSLFWVNHPLGMPVMGTGESVSAIKKDTLLNFIKRFYVPDKIIIAAAGNIEHNAVVEHFKPLFESMEPGDEEFPRTKPGIHSGISCNYKDLEQVHICLGGEAPHLSSDNRFAGIILNTILGGSMSSCLFQEIREKRGLAYAVYSFLSAYMDAGLMAVYVGTGPLDANRSLSVINKEIKKIQRGEISKPDLSDAREHLIGGLLLGAESTDARMMRLAKNEYVFGRYFTYEELVMNLEKVTVDKVVAVAGDIFKSDKVSLTTLGPFKREDLDLDCLRFIDC